MPKLDFTLSFRRYDLINVDSTRFSRRYACFDIERRSKSDERT
jgi:hypothetical protein